MNCFDIQEKIIDLVIGELTPLDEELIREHVAHCSMCRQELEFLSGCLNTCCLEDTETCAVHFQDVYWSNFVSEVHERITHEKQEQKFPYHIVIPVAASALIVLILGYIFLRPSPKETVEEEPSYYQYDPYDEMEELSPEEKEEFIELINQRYGE